jgi:hypothetical protein
MGAIKIVLWQLSIYRRRSLTDLCDDAFLRLTGMRSLSAAALDPFSAQDGVVVLIGVGAPRRCTNRAIKSVQDHDPAVY